MSFSTVEEATKAYEVLEAKLSKVETTAETRKQERIDLQKQFAELKSQFEGFNPEEYQKLKEEAETRRRQALEDKGKFDELKKEQDGLIKQLQTKLSAAETSQKDAIASSLARERNFHLASEFIKAGGIPEQVDNFLTVGGDLFSYELGEEGAKGTLKTAETILGEDNKQISTPVEALNHYKADPRYGVFFKAENNSNSGAPAGGSPNPTGGGSVLDGKTWIE